MNKFQKAGVATVAAFGMSFAAGSLWGPNTEDFQSLQVKVPDAVACWADNPTPTAENPCYNSTAGWWYGYGYNGGAAEVHREGSWIPFEEGVGITEEADGSSLIDPDALRVRLTAQSEDGTKYGGGGVGFDFGKPKSETVNITSYGGYCLTYSSNGALVFKLGWNESVYGDCTWDFALPSTSGTPTAVKLPWDKFKRPTYDGCEHPITVPQQNAEAVKIATNATQSVNPSTVELAIYQLGWHDDDCNTSGASPVTAKAKISGAMFDIVGRTVSLAPSSRSSVVGAVAVQVVNLQGAVVHTATIAPEGKMQLNNLPTGVYMLRAPALGYTSRIMLK